MSWETIYNRIEDEFGEDAVRNAPMSERINFRVGGPADILVRPRHIARLQRLMRLISGTDVPTFIFSGGSNLIVRDGGIRGVVIDVSQGFDEMSFTRMPDGTTHLFIGAGRTVADMVDACAERGLAGVEWGAGIPGTVGGGIKGNAGTRDGDFAGSLRSVQMVEFDGHLSDYERRDLVFRYRGLVKIGRFIIVSGVLVLRDGDKAAIRKSIDDMIAWRYERQPYEMASAGSIFKNPPEAPAGRLIDQAGLKGTRVGGAMVSDVHTNFIVNEKEATARDILELIEIVKAKVKEVHGVDLLQEVIVVGEDDRTPQKVSAGHMLQRNDAEERNDDVD